MTAIAPRPLSPILRWSLMALGAIALASSSTLFQDSLFNPAGWPQLARFLSASLHPDLSPALLSTASNALLTTFAYAVCGSSLSLAIGSLLGLLYSEVGWESLFPNGIFPNGIFPKGLFPHGLSQKTGVSQGSPAKRPAPGLAVLSSTARLRSLLAIPRAIHELIWGLILVNIWGTDPITGVIAIGLPFGLITAKVFSEILDESPRKAWQALRHSGADPWAAFCYGLLPQAWLNLLSYSFYRFECSLRSAAVLGMIGVGGLGTEIHVSLQSLRYEQLWTFFYALVLLNGLVDLASAFARRQLGCATRLDLNMRQNSAPSSKRSKRIRPASRPGWQVGLPLTWISGLGLLGLVGFSWTQLSPNLARVTSPRSFQLLGELLSEGLPPDWSLFPNLPVLGLQTLAMSVLAIALATLFSTVLAFFAASTVILPGGLLNPRPAASGARWANGLSLLLAWLTLGLSRGLLLFARAIPAPVWALVLLYVLFPGILPGAIALAIHNCGILGRLKAEVIENLDPAPLDSLAAQGAPPALIFSYGILPLTLPRFLAYGFYRWEVCLRETVIVGLVGAGGLGYLVKEQVSSFDYAGLCATLLGFMVLTWAVDYLSSQARRALR